MGLVSPVGVRAPYLGHTQHFLPFRVNWNFLFKLARGFILSGVWAPLAWPWAWKMPKICAGGNACSSQLLPVPCDTGQGRFRGFGVLWSGVEDWSAQGAGPPIFGVQVTLN